MCGTKGRKIKISNIFEYIVNNNDERVEDKKDF